MLKSVSSITNAIGALNFKGTWNATTNTPTIVSGVGVKGDYFVVAVAGSTTIDGISNWGVGDWIVYNGNIWQRVEGGADLNGVNLTVTNTTTLSGLTASTALALDASKNVVSVANTGTGDNVLATSPTLVTPALGTPSALVGTNITGTATAFTASNVTTNANLTGAVTSTGNATLLGSFSSADLAGALTDETGTGSAVFATSPTLVTPVLGTPSSGTVTNLTGTASININGTVGATTPATGAFTTLGASSTATFAAGAVGTPAITTTGDTNTGIFFPAADTIAFAEGGAEAMRIDSNGNLLVGTTSVNNAGVISIDFDGQAKQGITLDDTFAGVGGAYLIFRNSSGNNAGLISHTGTTTVAYLTTSDYRLKENIQPMQNALATVAQLKPVTYTWKEDGSAGEGFIAHELQEVAPYAVTGKKDGEQMQGVDYGKLTPILTAALQEAIAKIETLEARIAVLEAK